MTLPYGSQTKKYHNDIPNFNSLLEAKEWFMYLLSLFL